MSHPYWPQPGYLFQRAQPHGPYPDAMGDYGSRYTHGSFTRRKHYALPTYVAAERTGLEGLESPFEHGTTYYGFGEFQVGNITITCAPGEIIDRFVGKLPGLPNPVALIKEPLKQFLKTLTATSIQEMMSKVTQGQAAFETWFKVNVSYNIEQATGGLVSQSAVNLALPYAYNSIYSVLNECKESVAPTTIGKILDPSQYPPNSQPDGAACVSSVQCISGLCSGGRCVVKPTMLEAKPMVSTATMELKEPLQWEPWKYAVLKVTPTTTPTPTKTGVGTVAILGAAALAALLLLRR